MRIGFFYDYDLTLTEEFQQTPVFREFFPELQKKYGIKSPDEYWNLCLGKEKGIRWMDQFLKDSKTTFNHLTNKRLQEEFASKVKLAEGLPSWFDRINKYASSLNLKTEHHVLTVGLYPLIAGSKIAPYLTSIVGGEFLDKGKGIYRIESIMEPFKKVEHLKRICKGGNLFEDFSIEGYHINYGNAIVFGDGETDKDIFKYVKQRGGTAIAVFKKGDREAFDKCVTLLGATDYAPSFINTIQPRDYSEGSALEKKIFQTLQNLSEAEKNCDMDWELVNKWKLDHIKNEEVIKVVKDHYNSCKYCQKKTELDFTFN